VNRASASAKLNFALVVGPRRDDGLHEVATVLQRIDLADRIEVEQADDIRVTGFADDTLVARALSALAAETGACWHAKIEKQIPTAAGLGGGSSDAATALTLANQTLDDPLPPERLHELAAQLGADVPFFLTSGPQLATGSGRDLQPLELPQDFWIVIVLPRDARKESTQAVYERFTGHDGFADRCTRLLDALDRVTRAADLAALPPNDLAQSPFADELRAQGAFRAEVSGAGPAVYGLFTREADARAAAVAWESRGRVWLTVPAWYG
jgi:4-diphosphocytidyl-2-C-methyl-D-erythritol kinase